MANKKKQSIKKQSRKKQKTLLNFFTVRDANEPVQTTSFSNNELSKPESVLIDEAEKPSTHGKEGALVVSSSEEADTLKGDKKRSRKHIIENDEDSEEEEEILHNGRQKKIKRRIIESDEDETLNPIKPTTLSSSDIEDDLEFLDKSDILKERTRGKQVSRFSEALSRLKADRKSRLAQYDRGERGPIEEFAVDSSDEESEDDDSDKNEDDDSDNGFVVDDDIIDGFRVENSKAMMELPPEFSKTRILSFKRQLMAYIEYLVELVVNPVFDPSKYTYSIASTARYCLAKEAVTKRVQAYRDSMVTSDVWLSSFKEALDKYSKWEEMKEPIYDIDIKCEACRTNKPASMKIALSDMNGQGDQEIFYLGSECCRKGQMYHHFKHFASHMFLKVKTIVDDIRSKHRGLQEPNAIYTQMLREGYIRKLTKDVRKSLNGIVKLYNLKGHRSRIEDSSSSSSEEEL
ncbi:Uncharacterized protein C17H9.06c [Choanephora cucurbitarum]|uniref:Uncharacterized protein C17H9.06c n=1 Tax=Choanephora cucurbitarum TaxID=101091 RepID=A0A1C7N1E5_9FUNG|nr:Uncharacterized protein C17H9.06c [Choanephora cucurbitarum]